MKKLLAFTLAEAVLTMTILGVLAATMVANLKPAQYRTKGLVTKAGKIYEELDQATNMIISECTQTISLSKTYVGCTRTGTPVDMFTGLTPTQMGALYERYMRLTACSTSGVSCKLTDVTPGTNASNNRKCYLTKNNANICFYPNNKKIDIDVNNTEGPNSGTSTKEDQHQITLDANGISSTMPTVEAATNN